MCGANSLLPRQKLLSRCTRLSARCDGQGIVTPGPCLSQLRPPVQCGQVGATSEGYLLEKKASVGWISGTPWLGNQCQQGRWRVSELFPASVYLARLKEGKKNSTYQCLHSQRKLQQIPVPLVHVLKLVNLHIYYKCFSNCYFQTGSWSKRYIIWLFKSGDSVSFSPLILPKLSLANFPRCWS